MNILFISTDCIGINLAYLLKKEGHSVKLFIKTKKSKGNFDNLVPKTTNWRKELKWVGKDGLIIFDDTGWGKIQDDLRKKGYAVLGGCEIGDKLEREREFGQKIFKEYGLKTVPLKDFKNMEEAIKFIYKNPQAWVVKHNEHDNKFLTYIGKLSDGQDVISVLKNYLQNKHINRERITLHKKIDGIELGVGRYFNGTDWVGPIEMNVEHTKLFPGDTGPITSEMGTVAWYDEDENNKLFVDVLNKLKPFLQKINFRGDFEINCIVNETGAYPLEATARFGTPIIHLQSEIHISPWGEFLSAVARGEQYDLKYKKGYGVVNLLATPPFPYGNHSNKDTLYGVNVYFDKKLTSEDKEHIYFEEIARRTDSKNEQFYISNTDGYIMFTSGIAKTVKEAREKSLAIAKQIVIPKVFYRNDIGQDFEERQLPILKKWGYIK
jgi:phosphoribosylamine---glycine ligase